MSALVDSAALKVFGIPELARLICASNRRNDNVNLMRVCHQLFHDMLPFVWEEIDDGVILVSMIPGGGIFTYNADICPLVVMRYPVSLDLSRFSIYAPHVKRLRLPFVSYVEEYENWDEFFACIRSIDLLPNLESIHLSFPSKFSNTVREEKIGLDLVNWIIVFLSRSLLELVMTPPELTHYPSYLTWVDMGLSHKLFESVSRKCPNIHTLKFTPGDVKLKGPGLYWFTSPVLSSSFSYDSPEFGLSLVSLSNLVSLLVSPFILNPGALSTIASLPALDSLHILGLRGDHRVYCRDLKLSPESFPALRHLELNRLTRKTMVNICTLEPLASRLRSLSIAYPQEAATSSGDTNESQPTIFDIITTLTAYNKKLDQLFIHQINEATTQIHPESMESWAKLPLVTLRLGWQVLLNYGFETLLRLLSFLPLLEELVVGLIQMDYFNLKQVRAIVGLLPRLCYIRIPVVWESVRLLTQVDYQPLPLHHGNTLCFESLFYLLEPEEEKDAENIARFLSALRPASRVVCRSAEPSFYLSLIGGYVYQEPKDLINRMLGRICVA